MKIYENNYEYQITVPYIQYDDGKVTPKLVKFTLITGDNSNIQGLTLYQWFDSILKNKLVMQSTSYEFPFAELTEGCLYVERLDLNYITDLFNTILSEHLTLKSITYDELY